MLAVVLLDGLEQPAIAPEETKEGKAVIPRAFVDDSLFSRIQKEGRSHMNDWIKELGFWEYLKRFPLNPISLICGVVALGALALALKAALRKLRARVFLARYPDAAILTFGKTQGANSRYAENIRILSRNGEAPRMFFARPAVPAIYLSPGNNVLRLSAWWVRKEGGALRKYKSPVLSMGVVVKPKGMYRLAYHIPTDAYMLTEAGDAGLS